MIDSETIDERFTELIGLARKRNHYVAPTGDKYFLRTYALNPGQTGFVVFERGTFDEVRAYLNAQPLVSRDRYSEQQKAQILCERRGLRLKQHKLGGDCYTLLQDHRALVTNRPLVDVITAARRFDPVDRRRHSRWR